MAVADGCSAATPRRSRAEGSVDEFELLAPDVGEIRHIRIGHDSDDAIEPGG